MPHSTGFSPVDGFGRRKIPWGPIRSLLNMENLFSSRPDRPAVVYSFNFFWTLIFTPKSRFLYNFTMSFRNSSSSFCVFVLRYFSGETDTRTAIHICIYTQHTYTQKQIQRAHMHLIRNVSETRYHPLTLFKQTGRLPHQPQNLFVVLVVE